MKLNRILKRDELLSDFLRRQWQCNVCNVCIAIGQFLEVSRVDQASEHAFNRIKHVESTGIT